MALCGAPRYRCGVSQAPLAPSPGIPLVGLIGVAQILGYGSTYYLMAVIGAPLGDGFGWSSGVVFGGVSWGALVWGLAAPRVGRAVDRFGGRPVLIAGSLLMAASLAALGLAQGVATYYLTWTLIGLAMASATYDAAFAMMGRLWGLGARRAITGVTLVAGFASTLCWPLTTLLLEQFGWRGACFTYAALHLLIGLPIHVFAVPSLRGTAQATAGAASPTSLPPAPGRLAMPLLMGGMTLYAFITAAYSLHMLDVLRQLGRDAATALLVGTLMGPSQVLGRLVEFVFGRAWSPLVVARFAAGALPLAMASMLLLGEPGAYAFALLYGVGIGLLTIAKGTLPLALFGAQGFGARLGRIARPVLFAAAVAPFAFGVVMERAGTQVAVVLTLVMGVAAFACFATLRLPSATQDETRQ